MLVEDTGPGVVVVVDVVVVLVVVVPVVDVVDVVDVVVASPLSPHTHMFEGVCPLARANMTSLDEPSGSARLNCPRTLSDHHSLSAAVS